jgi:polyphenol oxidase
MRRAREASMALVSPLIRSPLLAASGFPDHGFTTRFGVDGEEVDLGDPRGRDAHDVARAWDVALGPFGGGVHRVVLLRQVHGAAVVLADRPSGLASPFATADAVITATPGLVLAVRTADCVPILLAVPGAVAAVHAGWRGLVAGVISEAVRRLCEVSGCRSEVVVAAVGPHAGVDHYETGPEVVDALVASGLDRARVGRLGPRGREHTDLAAAAVEQLAGAGVVRVDLVNPCTISEPGLHSHRRDGGAAGRQAALIALGS